MKHLQWLLSICLLCFLTVESRANSDTTFSPGVNAYPCGINWLTTDYHLAGGHWAQVMDSALGFNMHHVGLTNSASWKEHPDINPPGWSTRSNSKLIAVDQSMLLNQCTFAERMRYEAADTLHVDDRLRKFVFKERDNSTGIQGTSPYQDYWVVKKDLSNVNADDKVLWNNEQFNECGSWYRTFRDSVHTPFRVAVRMQTANLPVGADTSKIILTIKTFIHRYHRVNGDCNNLSKETTDLVNTFDIPWGWMRKTDSDHVFFSDTFLFPVPPRFKYPRVRSGFTYTDSDSTYGEMSSDFQLEIHSKRYDTTRILWVTIEDSMAHEFMAGFDLDTGNTTLKNKYRTIRDSIIAEARYMDTATHGKLFSYYLGDEAQVSEFACQGRVASLLKDSFHANNETERELYEETRYSAFCAPRTFRLPMTARSDAAMCLYDHGPGNGHLVCWEPGASARDGGTPFYNDSTMRQWKFSEYGYYPYRTSLNPPGGRYMVDSEYAMVSSDVAHFTVGSNDTMCGRDSMQTDSSFDLFDYDLSSFQQTLAGNFRVAAKTDSMIFFPIDTTLPHPAEWWSNIFMQSWLSLVMSDTNILGGYFSRGTPPVPEQLNVTSCLSLLTGCHGLLYWWASTNSADGIPDQWQTGFTDHDGFCHSDSLILGIGSLKDTLLTMYRRNSLWAKKFSDFLKGPARELYDKKFLGCYMRIMTWAGLRDSVGIVLDSMTIGANNVINPTKDSMWRPMLTHWVTTDAAIASNVKTVAMNDSLKWEAIGLFASPTDTNVRYAMVLNLYCDPRNLRTHLVNNADSAINHQYVMRGERDIQSNLCMDSSTYPYYRVIRIDTTVRDTGKVIAANGSFREHYFAGGSHIFLIEPYCNDIYSGIQVLNNLVVPMFCVYTESGQNGPESPTVLVPLTDSTRTISVYGELDLGLKNGGMLYNPTYQSGGDVDSLNITVMSGGKVVVKTGADAHIVGAVTVQSGGTFTVDSGAIVRFGSKVNVQQGGSFIILPGGDVRWGNHSHLCSGVFEFKGVASGSSVQSQLQTFESGDSTGLFIQPSGVLVMDKHANVNLNASVAIDTGALWTFVDSTVTKLHTDKVYQVEGAFTASGSSGNSVMLRCDSDYAIINIGIPFTSTFNPNAGIPLATASLRYATFDSVSMLVVNSRRLNLTRCSFRAWMDYPFALEIDNCDSSLVDSCQFSMSPRTGFGIYLHDNLSFGFKPVAIKHSSIKGFLYGISTDGSRCLVSRDTIDSCLIGIIVFGSLTPSWLQVFDSNLLKGTAHSSDGDYGFWLENSNPYLYNNEVKATAIGVRCYGGNSATLACNNIHNNSSYGVYARGVGNTVHMDHVNWQKNNVAANTVVFDTIANIWMDSPAGIILDSGFNNLDQGFSASRKIISDTFMTAGNYAGYQARFNSWGALVTNPLPLCSGGWRTSAWTYFPVATPHQCVATASSPSTGGTDSNCLFWAAAFAEADSGDTCDFLTKEYNKQIFCGPCDSAVAALKQMIIHCDAQSSQDLREHLANLLGSTIACHDRDCSPLHALHEWLLNYIADADSAWKINAAMWEIGEVLAAMQNFDSAAVIFNAIRTGNWPAPEDSARAHFFQSRMEHLAIVEGSTSDCWGSGFGKQAMLRDAGKAGEVPIGVNPIDLLFYPSPAHPNARVLYSVPTEDQSDLTEVRVFTLLGQDVTTLVSDIQPAGRHTVEFDGSRLRAGAYVVAVHTSTHMQSKMIVVQK